MNTYQAAFAVLIVFLIGDAVGAITKARISSMFVIMMGFMIMFMTGLYPTDIMDISGFSKVSSIGLYFLIFNMGTSVDLQTLKKEWRTVVCAALGLLCALIGCMIAMPLVGKEFSFAAGPVINGGIVSTTLMIESCENAGFQTAASLALFIYATQKFVGTLPASNCGLSYAHRILAEYRSGESKFERREENVENKPAKKTVVDKLKKYYSPYTCLGIASAVILVSYYLGKVCNGWINTAIWIMIFGIILRNVGLVPHHVLRDYANANGFFSFLAMCTIIPSLAKVDWSQVPIIGVKAVILYAAALLVMAVVFFFTPAWKIIGDKKLSIGICCCQFIGYPGTELIANEIANATSKTDEEKDMLLERIRTAYVISGFTSVTILSVFIAGIFSRIIMSFAG